MHGTSRFFSEVPAVLLQGVDPGSPSRTQEFCPTLRMQEIAGRRTVVTCPTAWEQWLPVLLCNRPHNLRQIHPVWYGTTTLSASERVPSPLGAGFLRLCASLPSVLNGLGGICKCACIQTVEGKQCSPPAWLRHASRQNSAGSLSDKASLLCVCGTGTGSAAEKPGTERARELI